MAITAHKIKHVLDKQTRLQGIKYNEYNETLNPIYVEIEDKSYKVTEDLETKKFEVEEVGSKEKTTLDTAEVESFDFIQNNLVHAKFRNTEGELLEKTVQFLEMYKYNTMKFYYRGTYMSAKIYDKNQFELKKYMAPPVVIDYGSKILSPMPGAVISVNVKVGDTIVDGQELCVLEAMKMQNMIKSERDGKIKSVLVKKGQSVGVDEILIEFE